MSHEPDLSATARYDGASLFGKLSREAARIVQAIEQSEAGRSRSVDPIEFRRAVRSLIQSHELHSDQEIDRCFAAMDEDDTGVLDLDDLFKKLRPLVKQGFEHAVGWRPSFGKGQMLGTNKLQVPGNVHASDAAELAIGQLKDLLRNNKVRVLDLFRSWDDDRDGKISSSDFRKAIAMLGYRATPAAIDNLFQRFDPTGSGMLEYHQINRLLRPSSPPSPRRRRRTSHESQPRSPNSSAPPSPILRSPSSQSQPSPYEGRFVHWPLDAIDDEPARTLPPTLEVERYDEPMHSQSPDPYREVDEVAVDEPAICSPKPPASHATPESFMDAEHAENVRAAAARSAPTPRSRAQSTLDEVRLSELAAALYRLQDEGQRELLVSTCICVSTLLSTRQNSLDPAEAERAHKAASAFSQLVASQTASTLVLPGLPLRIPLVWVFAALAVFMSGILLGWGMNTAPLPEPSFETCAHFGQLGRTQMIRARA